METIVISFIVVFEIWMSTVVHEMGHVLLMLILNIKINEIVIGGGIELIKFKLGGTKIVFGLDFSQGIIKHKNIDSNYKQILASLGGPLFDFISALLVFLYIDFNKNIQNYSLWEISLLVFMGLSLGGGIYNLIPDGLNSDGEEIKTSLKSVFK